MKNVFKAVLFMLAIIVSAVLIQAAANIPALTAIGSKSVNEGQALNFIVTASAADAGAINFSVCQTPPCVGTKVNAISATSSSQITIGGTKVNYSFLTGTTMGFNWTPDFTQSGTYSFRFNVTDDDTNNTFEDVSVTVADVPPKMTVPATLAIGGGNQERSNPNHDTDDRKETNVTSSLVITNSGSEVLNSIKGSASYTSGFSDKDIMLNWTLPKTSLAVGESMTVPISVRVPQKLDAVSKAFTALNVNVATLTFTSTSAIAGSSVTGSASITEMAENNLKIKNIKVRYGDKTKTVDDGDKVEKMRAGQDVEFEIEIENRFSNKQDVAIEDITVRALSDSQMDIDEEDEISSLGADDTDTVKFTAVIDEDADDGTYNIEVSALGTDEFGARHGEKNVIEFQVKRESHEIEIKKITVSPSTVACEQQATLSVNIRNSGRRDEDEVYVAVASPELKFGARSELLQLDKDDEDTVSFSVAVPESTARPATYRLTVDTYYNTGTRSMSDAGVLKVEMCGTGQEEEQLPAEEPSTQPPAVQPPVQQPTAGNTPTPSATAEKKGFMQTPQYVALLVLAYAGVIGGGLAFLVKLLRKP